MDPRKDRKKLRASPGDSQPIWLRRFLKGEEELNHLEEPYKKWKRPENNNKRKGRR